MIYNLESMEGVDVYKLRVSCVKGYVFYHQSKYYQHIVDEMLLLTGGKWEKAVRWWVTNSARCMNRGAVGFTVSLRSDSYTRNKQGIGYRGVKALIDFLEQRSFIHVYKGYVSEWKTVGGKRVPEETVPSIITLRKRALSLWEGVYVSETLWKDIEEQQIVQIRDRSTKQPLPTKGRKGMKEERETMKGINKHLANSEITFEGEPIADVMYSRIFSGDMKSGGRLYAVGGGVQTLPQGIRLSSLRIDGEPVVELDYSAIHPNICYQILKTHDGINVYDILGDDFSPYGANLDFVEVDQTLKEEWEMLTGKPHNPVRNLAKLAILISMNSKDRREAVASLANKVVLDRSKPREDQQFYAIVGKVPAPLVCQALQDHNDIIREHFFTDTGILLQYTDSNIMLEVVNTMIQKGNTVLCYHDSAIVKKSAEQDLYKAMRDAWITVLGDDTFCKIDRK